MFMEACGCLWIPVDRYWCLWRFIGICGCQLIGISGYGGLEVSVDIIGCMYNRTNRC